MEEHRSDKIKILNRLRRIEGQLRGLQRMVTDEKSCQDILIQLDSVQAALQQVSLLLLENLLDSRLAEGMRQENSEQKEQIDKIVGLIMHFASTPFHRKGTKLDDCCG
jgi:DNA-binding FrmR family transcriptional regulator